MKVLVHWVNFHPDNYQGAQGASFEFKTLLSIPDGMEARDVQEFILKEINIKSQDSTPFEQDRRFSVQRIELFL